MSKENDFVDKLKSRSWLRVISGSGIVLLVLFLNGLLTFIPFGFDFKQIATGAYWSSYFTNVLSGVGILIGVYIIKKSRNLRSPTIGMYCKTISNNRLKVLKEHKLKEASAWIKDWLNYKNKLDAYCYCLNLRYSKLNLDKPFEDEKNYERKLQRFNKNKARETVFRKELELVSKDYERLDLLVKKGKTETDKKQIVSLNEHLHDEKTDYKFIKSKVKYEESSWRDLTSDHLYEEHIESGAIKLNEGRELVKKLAPAIGVGLLLSSFISVITFGLAEGVTWLNFVYLACQLLYLLMYVYRGIAFADDIILGKYCNCLKNRVETFNQMLIDIECFDIDTEEELKIKLKEEARNELLKEYEIIEEDEG